MKKIELGTTAVYIEPIGASLAAPPRSCRRQREKEAVRRIACALGIEILHDADGAPAVTGARISVSHSMRLAVVAIDPFHPIGIDAEEWREALWRVRTKFLTKGEICRFVDEGDLLWAWTVKEAVYKAADSPRPQMAEIECSNGKGCAVAQGRRYALRSWMEGNTRLTLAYPCSDAAD